MKKRIIFCLLFLCLLSSICYGFNITQSGAIGRLGNVTLSAATGNEVAYTLNYTTNKATSGNDTGLVINQTDTASPGTSLLADFQVGGVSKANINNNGNIVGGSSLGAAGGIFSWNARNAAIVGNNTGAADLAIAIVGTTGGNTANMTQCAIQGWGWGKTSGTAYGVVGLASSNASSPTLYGGYFTVAYATSLYAAGSAALVASSKDQTLANESGVDIFQGNNNAGNAFVIKSTGNVGIGTGLTPNANAILDVASTTKAFMPPRMTTTQRDAIATPTEGMVIYNLTTHVLDFYNGTVWGPI